MPSLIPSLLLPLYITRMQIFKASTSEKRTCWRDLKADPPSVRSDSHPTFPSFSFSLERFRCMLEVRVFSFFFFFFYCAIKARGAELCFRWSLNPRQIKALRLWAIYYDCLLPEGLRHTEWVTGTKALGQTGFHWLGCCRQPSTFQYLQAFISLVSLAVYSEVISPWR